MRVNQVATGIGCVSAALALALIIIGLQVHSAARFALWVIGIAMIAVAAAMVAVAVRRSGG